jgi:hypothetical protein
MGFEKFKLRPKKNTALQNGIPSVEILAADF